jgi:hypothetical protein
MNEIVTTTTVERIQILAAELETLGKTALVKAVEAGNLLRECKAGIAHGQWIPWLESNFTFADRTARRWMKLAEDMETGKLKSDTVSNLAEAYRITTEPHEAEDQDDRPENFEPLNDGGKERCRLWWDSCASEVLARWAMGIPAETIAEHVGRPLDEVERIIRPRFIAWDSYGSNGVHVPAELYDKSRRSLAASWMSDAASRAPLKIDSDLKPSPATEKAKRRLEAKEEHYRDEFKATYSCSPFQLFTQGFDTAKTAKTEDEMASGWFFYKIGEASLNDARHACAIQDYPNLNHSDRLLLHWHALFEGITQAEFKMLIADPDGFRELVKSKEERP